MSTPTVTRLTLYPIKSCGGVSLERAHIGPRGLEAGPIGDRRWILSDAEGQMITQRQTEHLARVRIDLLGGALRVSGDGLEPVVVDPADIGDERASVMLFRRAVPGHRSPKAVDDWFSRFLGYPAHLLYQTEEDHRLCDPDFALTPGQDKVGFADAFPYLISTEATLARVNGLLAEPVPMNRFRPNIVVGGTGPDAEYDWKRVAMGHAEALHPLCDDHHRPGAGRKNRQGAAGRPGPRLFPVHQRRPIPDQGRHLWRKRHRHPPWRAGAGRCGACVGREAASCLSHRGSLC
jgi:uncharacterized protein YcbX